jgi:hypothetical protein
VVPRLSFGDATVFSALAFAEAPLPPFAATAFATFVFPAAGLRRAFSFFFQNLTLSALGRQAHRSLLLLRVSSFLLF